MLTISSINMTDPRAAKIMDDLIVLFDLYKETIQYSSLEDAFTYIKQSRVENGQPITMSLQRRLLELDPDYEKRPAADFEKLYSKGVLKS